MYLCQEGIFIVIIVVKCLLVYYAIPGIWHALPYGAAIVISSAIIW